MLMETVFDRNCVFSFCGRKINGVYVPTGTIADVVELLPQCGHKKCSCTGILRVQGIVKKDAHSIGKPFFLDIATFRMDAFCEGASDLVEREGFKGLYCKDGHHPTSFSELPL